MAPKVRRVRAPVVQRKRRRPRRFRWASPPRAVRPWIAPGAWASVSMLSPPLLRYQMIVSYDLSRESSLLPGRRPFQPRPRESDRRRPPGRCGSTSRTAASAAPTCTSLTARWTAGCGRLRSLATRCRGRSPSSARGSRGSSPGDPIVVRPLDTRAESPADRGYSHIGRGLKFLGIDTAGRVPELLDRARLHPPPRTRLTRPSAGGIGRAARRRLP